MTGPHGTAAPPVPMAPVGATDTPPIFCCQASIAVTPSSISGSVWWRTISSSYRSTSRRKASWDTFSAAGSTTGLSPGRPAHIGNPGHIPTVEIQWAASVCSRARILSWRDAARPRLTARSASTPAATTTWTVFATTGPTLPPTISLPAMISGQTVGVRLSS